MRDLKRDIGFFGAAFIVLNSVIGAGIFALPGKVAVTAGLASPWLFLVVGVLFLSVILTFAELASYYDRTGGPVLYAGDAFGPLVGFSTGWLIFLARMTSFAANANVMAMYLASLSDLFAGPVVRAAIITLVTIGLTWANILGVKDGVRTMGVLTFFKIVPLLLLIALGLQHVTGTTLLPGDFHIEDIGGTTLLLIYAYVGFETIGATAGETSNPQRNIPTALVRTVVLTALFYFLIVLVFVAVVPAERYASATLVDVGRELSGSVGAVVITLTAVFSIGGNLASSMLAAPRILFSLAENRALPQWLAHVSEKYSTPDRSILLMGAMALVLGLSSSFVELAIGSSVVRMLAFSVCILALPSIRRQASDEQHELAYRLPGGYAIPAVALGVCLFLISHSRADDWLRMSIPLAIGVGLYFAARKLGSGRDEVDGEGP
ncbi:MAG: APC family permease [Gammaproteobacteria bacterium]|nr:APC family permease [Gammaproteobacteria bacterium]MBT8104231.1 APC family permease [Gammaproteobacteria bacterium]NNF49070.1 amino acid permease [Woeseiaceae bacterium]NNK24246.1 amino acid permease [Woeseiaceae bacterium]NNL63867.1 amino acid permease [Woeseiaceae bacterium]